MMIITIMIAFDSVGQQVAALPHRYDHGVTCHQLTLAHITNPEDLTAVPLSRSSYLVDLMSARYAPIPSHRPELDSDNELEAAFDDSDDEDDSNVSETHPLNRRNALESSPPPVPIPGAYDFERIDYDVPPPGSPTRAMANDFGNSNGLIPSFNTDVDNPQSNSSRNGFLRRTAATILPSYYVDRFGLSQQSQHYRPARPVGGGSSNDGVFANMMAKPERFIRIQQGFYLLTSP
jgi:hypothetical protein